MLRPMAYSEELAGRVSDLLSAHSDVSERRMFGGVGFLIAGNMAVGVIGDELIVRLGPEEGERALSESGVREFDFTGRPMRGWVFVAPEATADDDQLEGWVEAGAAYAESLPPKS